MKPKTIIPKPSFVSTNKLKWEDTIQPQDFKRNIETSIINPIKNSTPLENFSYIIYGPPGTGKTTFLEGLSRTLEWKLCYIGPENLLIPGKTVEEVISLCKSDIKKLVENKDASKTIFAFDEIDEMVVSRDSDTDRATRFATTMMLPIIQELRNWAKNHNFLLFFLTNHIERFDPAVTRQGRFDLILPLGPPDRVGRFLLFERFLDDLIEKNNSEGIHIQLFEYDSILDDKESPLAMCVIPHTDLDVISRASARLTLKDIEKICEKVVEQAKALKPNSVNIFIPTKLFIDWIYKFRNSRENKLAMEQYYNYKDFSRDALIYPKNNTIQELIEHEFASLVVKHNLSSLDEKWIAKKPIDIICSFRNLTGFSEFIGCIEIKIMYDDKCETHVEGPESIPAAEISDENSYQITPKTNKPITVEFTITGEFEVIGIEDVVLENSVILKGGTSISRKIFSKK